MDDLDESPMNHKNCKISSSQHYVSTDSDRVGYVHSGFWEGKDISKTIPGKPTNMSFDTFPSGTQNRPKFVNKNIFMKLLWEHAQHSVTLQICICETITHLFPDNS